MSEFTPWAQSPRPEEQAAIEQAADDSRRWGWIGAAGYFEIPAEDLTPEAWERYEASVAAYHARVVQQCADCAELMNTVRPSQAYRELMAARGQHGG